MKRIIFHDKILYSSIYNLPPYHPPPTPFFPSTLSQSVVHNRRNNNRRNDRRFDFETRESLHRVVLVLFRSPEETPSLLSRVAQRKTKDLEAAR